MDIIWKPLITYEVLALNIWMLSYKCVHYVFIVNDYCIYASCTYEGSVNLATRPKTHNSFQTGRITLFVVSPAPCTGLGDSRLEVKTSIVKESLV